jgi:4-amino-4-deoxy-L-arabinose transferase-like glycosyltransferase
MRRVLPALLAAALVAYFVNLGASSIWDANEAYYVETPREMIERGDYVNPTFNYEPRFNKPVLSYWIVAGLYHLFGVSVGVQRLAIAIAAMIIVTGAWFLARAASPHPLAPMLAAAGLAAGPRLFMFSRRILVDMAVTAFMTLTLLWFVLAERYPERRRLFLVLMYVSVGLGVLAKGPVAAAIPMIVFLAYLAAHRELHRLRDMMIPTGTAIALAIAAPWYVLLYLQHGWTHITGFFLGENVGRFLETVGVQARGPDFYLPVVFTDSLPWSLCLPGVVVAWWRERSRADLHHRIRTLLLLWIAAIVLLFSFSQTKQDLYIFPIVAAIAALGGDWIARTADTGPAAASPRGRGWLTGTLVALGVMLVLMGAVVLYLFGMAQTIYRVAGAQASGWLMVAGGTAILVFAGRRQRTAAVVAVLAVFIAFNWLLATTALPSFERYKPVVPLSRVIAGRAQPEDVVAHFDVALPSMVFYLRRHVDIWLDPEMLIQQLASERTVYVVLAANRYAELSERFAPDTCVVARHPTSDVRLRSILEGEPPPEVLLITNRCPAP